MKNTGLITHYDPWETPQRAILAECNCRLGSAVNGLQAPSRSVRSFDSHAAREQT